MAGEEGFGNFSDEELAQLKGASPRRERYRRMQRKLLSAAVEGRAFIFADTRNLREGILDPLLFGKYDPNTGKKSEALISNDILKAYDYDLRRIAMDAVGDTAAQKVASLTSKFQTKFGVAMDESTVLQILALGSGNIRAAAVPRQHSKQYALLGRFEGSGNRDYDIAAIVVS